MGQVFVKLMQRLGHEEFYIQGGDWGSVIATAMAQMMPQLVNVHSKLHIIIQIVY